MRGIADPELAANMAQTITSNANQNRCFAVSVSGQVQGVGFRPFIYRLAKLYDLKGRVKNSASGVDILVQGEVSDLEAFISCVRTQHPLLARIDSLKVEERPVEANCTAFYLDNSAPAYKATQIPADKAICQSCRDEILDTQNRRYGYAFNSCADCGPRYSMLSNMPFDRHGTSMGDFPLCPQCEGEYENPADRRFHAQGISCGDCGPSVDWLSPEGVSENLDDGSALDKAVGALSGQKILAVKGIGGFHLCCDACDEQTVGLLRQRKHRPAKPFALMMEDIQSVKSYFSLSSIEASQLVAPEAPIVLLPKSRLKGGLPRQLAENIAPDNAFIGVMLAYSPLHVLLLNKFGRPLVMTSANHNGAPVCIDNQVAINELGQIVDGFLVHNRNIVNRCDDSLVKIINQQPLLLRRARGYVPEAFALVKKPVKVRNVLAMGADLKNCFSLSKDNQVIVSAHNGDLSEPCSYLEVQTSIKALCHQLAVEPEAFVVDKHPDYFSRRLGQKLAQDKNVPLIQVQHHHAHIASCMLEHGLDGKEPVMAIALDGLGYGDDQTLWGGELLLGDYKHCLREGGLAPFPLLGGDKANREPWRNLLALLTEANALSLIDNCPLPQNLKDKLCSDNARILRQNADMFVQTSSAGRLFDAVAAMLLPFSRAMTYEAQAASELESLALQGDFSGCSMELPSITFGLKQKGGHLVLDPCSIWEPLIAALAKGVSTAQLAYWFHQCFVDSWLALVLEVRRRRAEQGLKDNPEILLTGGVFQNQIITELLSDKLKKAGLTVRCHQQIPCNDGGIAAGQIAIATCLLEQEQLKPEQKEQSLCV